MTKHNNLIILVITLITFFIIGFDIRLSTSKMIQDQYNLKPDQVQLVNGFYEDHSFRIGYFVGCLPFGLCQD